MKVYSYKVPADEFMKVASNRDGTFTGYINLEWDGLYPSDLELLWSSMYSEMKRTVGLSWKPMENNP